jgi:hypothetical protein
MGAPASERSDAWIVLAAWVALCALALGIAARDVSVPGLYHDEVIQAEPAREFLAADGKPLQIPGASSIRVFGRWLPLFIQPYMGGLKSQLLIPSFALFGASAASLRLTTLAWSLLGLLFAMEFARRLLGRDAALLGGALLAVDPSFLFVSRHDWGSFSLAFLLRSTGLCLLATSPRSPARWFAAGLCFGLGVYNKLDFAVPLAAAGLALVVVAPRGVGDALRTQPRRLLALAAGFGLGAAPMLLALGRTLLATRAVLAVRSDADSWREKFGAWHSLLDGSYFDRLMRSGGSFDRMFGVEGAAAGPFLAIYGLAIAFLTLRLVVRGRRAAPGFGPAFVLATAWLASLGILLTPRAVRIHHVLGVYPFPQLVVAAAVADLAGARGAPRRAARIAAAALVAAAALGGSLWVSLRTYDGIERSHGKGRWSDALGEFARELGAEPGGVVVVSLDWGFHAQLHFLDRALELRDPVWRMIDKSPHAPPQISDGDAHTVYLVNDRDFAVFPTGPAFLDAVQKLDPRQVTIRRHADREGDPAFVSIRFAGPHRIVYRGSRAARPFEVILLR